MQIKELKDFLEALPDDEAREAFAKSCETSIGHLRNVAYGQKVLNVATCVRVWRNSGGKVTRQVLRSDWRELWPELIGATIDPAGVAPEVQAALRKPIDHAQAADIDAERRNTEQARMLCRALVSRDGPSRGRGER